MKKILFSWLWVAAALSLPFVSCEKLKQPVNGVWLNHALAVLTVGEEVLLTATVDPSHADNQAIAWSSSNPAVATVTDGRVSTHAAGTAHIAVTTDDGHKTAICVVWVEMDTPIADTGVVINGVCWAESNVDAPGTFAGKREDTGLLYQWNRRTAWPVAGDAIGWDSLYAAGTVWEEVNDPSPAGWRLPVRSDFDKLLADSLVLRMWVLRDGVLGMKFTERASRRYLFLPAASYRDPFYGEPYRPIESGHYWTGTFWSYDLSWVLNFSSADAFTGYTSRSAGLSVRCVRAE